MTRSVKKLNRRPTLLDVARAAGVGTTTVSRVINGARYVDSKTLSRVQEVIARLAYQPSQAARALKSVKTRSIGLIVPTFRDPFFSNLASAVQQIAKQKDYVLLVLASHDDQLQETSELSFFRSYRVDGLLVVAPRLQSRRFLASLQALAAPIVALDRPLEFKCTSVLTDNYESSRSAVQHLIDHGRRRILCLGGAPDLYTILERVRGYEDAVRGAHLKTSVSLGFEHAQIAQALKAAFGRRTGRPDAIYAVNGPACIQAYEFIMDNGIAMPSEVALMGFDDLPFASSLRPAVSTVRQPVDDLGATAARVLFEQIETEISAPRKIVLENSLVLRASCGCDG